jgi:hypothetical protein
VTPFLLGFARAVVDRLRAGGDLVLVDDAKGEEVARFVADFLGDLRVHSQLVSGLSQALVECPDVEELFADDDRLQLLITDLPRSVLPR